MTDEYKFKQKDINVFSAIGLSLVVNYFVWYISPFYKLAVWLGIAHNLIWICIWGTLVGAGFCLIFLNRMFKPGGGLG